MKLWRLLGLNLLLWVASVNGDDNIDSFLRDLISTFQLTSPTIVYDTDKPPEICYTDQWVLCLSSKDPPQSNPAVELVLDIENCFTVAGPDPGKRCIFPFNDSGITYNACSNRAEARADAYYCPTDIARRTVLENNETSLNDVDPWTRGKWGYCGPECPVEGKENIHLREPCSTFTFIDPINNFYTNTQNIN